MRVSLKPHPDTPSSAIDRIEVQFDYEGRGWAMVTFRLEGDIDRIVVPGRSHAVEADQNARQKLFADAAVLKAVGIEPCFDVSGASDVGRMDGLWRTTCFEAFAKSAGSGYAEFNLSPSGEWAAYQFDSYRAGMASLDGSVQVDDVERATGVLEIRAILNWQGWPHATRLALSAVIEDVDGAISYWAVNHPSDKPDFHHPDSFVLDLP